MTQRDSRGKAADRSTGWSNFEWDQRGFWIASRLDPFGEREYDYRYSEGAQNPTPQEQNATPRFLGADVLNTTNFYYPSTSTTAETDYGAYPSANSAAYTTTSNTASKYGNMVSYSVVPPLSAGTVPQLPNDYVASDTESEATVRDSTSPNNPRYVVKPNYTTTSQALQGATNPAGVTQAIANMEIAGPSTQGNDIPNIGPNNENYGKLDPRYRVIEDRKQNKFWRVGRVFMVLWTEPAGKPPPKAQGVLSTHGSQASQFSTTYLEGTAFSEIRRFVVVGEGYGNSICSPIHTYGGQATLKYNLPEPSQHAIIYTSDRAPNEYGYKTEDGEFIQENLTKDPIRVLSEQRGPEGDLGTRSRINYSKVYTVENYVRVLNIGMVAPGSMQSLSRNSFVKPRETPIERPRNNPKWTSSHRDENSTKGKGKEKSKDKGNERRRR